MKSFLMLMLLMAGGAHSATMVCQEKQTKKLFAVIQETQNQGQIAALISFNSILGGSHKGTVKNHSVIAKSGCYEIIKSNKQYIINNNYYINLTTTYQEGRDGTRCANYLGPIHFSGTYQQPRSIGTELECTYFAP